ncbi:MAG: hypothetical protein SGI86_12915 [Deltaproteobacteria bacterium]|nr:hypothetical protein [Deltaproteobacteria bacterium]
MMFRFCLLVSALALGGIPTARAQASSNASDTAQAPLGGSEEAYQLWVASLEYEEKKRDPWTAFGLELLLPGLGNHYAGEAQTAALTWTGLLIGTVWLLKGTGTFCRWTTSPDDQCTGNFVDTYMGWAFLVGSRLFGLTSAPENVLLNNRALKTRLGLDAFIWPSVSQHQVALGLGATF